MRQDYLYRLFQRQKEISSTTEALSHIQDIHSDLWEQRPQCDEEAMHDLESYISLARAHRNVKHQDAWNRLAAALLNDRDHPVAQADIESGRIPDGSMA